MDIGAGYGRVGIVMSTLYPEASFIGYEIIPQRLEEAERIFDTLDLGHCTMIEEDLSKTSFSPPAADVYFIYDFSDPLDIRKILGQIKEVNRDKPCFIIAKGDFIRPIIRKSHPELESVFSDKKKERWDIFRVG